MSTHPAHDDRHDDADDAKLNTWAAWKANVPGEHIIIMAALHRQRIEQALPYGHVGDCYLCPVPCGYQVFRARRLLGVIRIRGSLITCRSNWDGAPVYGGWGVDLWEAITLAVECLHRYLEVRPSGAEAQE
ncbi:hypothetical protein DB346_08490 [Verrucomicrobia bacterium LW23]|nr:hypothetical protein DB346_08490 [Verrucomicrobia bacterium LW23]